MFKKLKETIRIFKENVEIQKKLNERLKKMEESVEFFTGIAELFANYIIYDIRNSPTRGYHPNKATIINVAQMYLSKRDIFWRPR